MKQRLAEAYETRFIASIVNPNSNLERSLEQWGDIPLPELAVILVRLRHLYMVHQTHHWMSTGQASYGDHLLFQRIYEAIAGDVDSVAEKAVGLGCEKCVYLPVQAMQIAKLTTSMSGFVGKTPEAMVNESLSLELSFISDVATLTDRLRSRGALSRGLDNMLAGIEDAHENHCFLLKQRLKREAL